MFKTWYHYKLVLLVKPVPKMRPICPYDHEVLFKDFKSDAGESVEKDHQFASDIHIVVIGGGVLFHLVLVPERVVGLQGDVWHIEERVDAEEEKLVPVTVFCEGVGGLRVVKSE